MVFTQKITGNFRDQESCLDSASARYLSSAQGRFTGPDEPLIDQSEGDPQSWNLFSYVRNNPLKFVDPSGEDCIYLDGISSGTAQVEAGNCSNSSGRYFPGTIDPFSVRYSARAGRVDLSYTPYEGNASSVTVSILLGPEPMTYSQLFVNEMARRADASNQMIAAGALIGPSAVAATYAGPAAAVGARALARIAGATAVGKALVDTANLSSKIIRQMASRGWTKQDIVNTVRYGKAFEVTNKATGGRAIEYVNQSNGRFVVVDAVTRQVLQVSGPGHQPNHLLK